MKRDIFQGLADPTRRAIILLLAAGSMTPGAMAEHFQTSRQAVSKHLQVLTDCDLVRQEVAGREINYHINPRKMEELEKWLQKFRSLLDKRFRQLDDVLAQLKEKNKKK